MNATRLLGSKSLKRLSALTMLVDSALAFRRGDWKAGAALLAAAPLSARSTALGFAVQAGIRAYRHLRREGV